MSKFRIKTLAEHIRENEHLLPREVRSSLLRCAAHNLGREYGIPKVLRGAAAAHNLYFWFNMAAQQVDGTALTASVTATSILHATAKPVLQAQTLYIGKQYFLTAAGRVSNIVTTPGTLTLDVRFGNVVVANGGAMSLNTVAKTNVPWFLVWLLTCRAIGSSTAANMMHQGMWTSESVVGSALPTAGGAGTAMLPNAAPGVGTGFDSTANQTVDLFATWSLNNANSIQTHQFGWNEVS